MMRFNQIFADNKYSGGEYGFTVTEFYKSETGGNFWIVIITTQQDSSSSYLQFQNESIRDIAFKYLMDVMEGKVECGKSLNLRSERFMGETLKMKVDELREILLERPLTVEDLKERDIRFVWAFKTMHESPNNVGYWCLEEPQMDTNPNNPSLYAVGAQVWRNGTALGTQEELDYPFPELNPNEKIKVSLW